MPLNAIDDLDLAPTASLEDWMLAQHQVSAVRMARSISATGLTRHRTAFGQTVIPAPGSVVASPVPGLYDPDPDYFFHWLRDSALVMDACAVLIERGTRGADWPRRFLEFVRFSIALNGLRGSDVVAGRDIRENVHPDYRRYVRPDDELQQVEGDRVLAEARYNPDGTLDIIHWSRPQHDGPALRALAVLRHWELAPYTDQDREAMAILLFQDLDFLVRNWDRPSYDLWEDDIGQHYHTHLAEHAALLRGAAWADGRGDAARAHRYHVAAESLRTRLEIFWSPESGVYRCCYGTASAHPRQIDIAVILAVIHTRLPVGRHSILDERVRATMARLEDAFADYPINRNREPGLGPALGRFPGDRYFSGGAYYFATLAGAEFYYRLTAAVRQGKLTRVMVEDREFFARALRETGQAEAASGAAREAVVRALTLKGDAIMAMVRKYTPSTGALSEQFDQKTGAQTSAKELAWSYAAFITAFEARRQALG